MDDKDMGLGFIFGVIVAVLMMGTSMKLSQRKLAVEQGRGHYTPAGAWVVDSTKIGAVATRELTE